MSNQKLAWIGILDNYTKEPTYEGYCRIPITKKTFVEYNQHQYTNIYDISFPIKHEYLNDIIYYIGVFDSENKMVLFAELNNPKTISLDDCLRISPYDLKISNALYSKLFDEDKENKIMITKEMKMRTARNIYNELLFVKDSLMDAYCNSFVTAENVLEKMGHIIRCSIREIMSYLEIEEDGCGENYGLIADCVEDNDTFEFVLQIFQLDNIDYSNDKINLQIEELFNTVG